MDIPTLAKAAALAAALAAAQALPLPSALPPAEAVALRALERPALEELRGGAAGEDVALDPGERAALECIGSAELEAQRGGGVSLSDREVRLILITAGILLLIVLIF